MLDDHAWFPPKSHLSSYFICRVFLKIPKEKRKNFPSPSFNLGSRGEASKVPAPRQENDENAKERSYGSGG